MSRRRSPDDSPLGAFEEQILVAVFRTGERAYGMSVRREIERVTGRELAIGAVYATLERLEAKGFLTSDRKPNNGAKRRLFAVTSAGAQALAATRTMRKRLWKGVDLERLLTLSRE